MVGNVHRSLCSSGCILSLGPLAFEVEAAHHRTRHRGGLQLYVSLIFACAATTTGKPSRKG